MQNTTALHWRKGSRSSHTPQKTRATSFVGGKIVKIEATHGKSLLAGGHRERRCSDPPVCFDAFTFSREEMGCSGSCCPHRLYFLVGTWTGCVTVSGRSPLKPNAQGKGEDVPCRTPTGRKLRNWCTGEHFYDSNRVFGRQLPKKIVDTRLQARTLWPFPLAPSAIKGSPIIARCAGSLPGIL